jgi:lactoylglutathione lyase
MTVHKRTDPHYHTGLLRRAMAASRMDTKARVVGVISGVSKVIVPVDDEAQAKEFWTARLGFDVVRDETYADERWIEVSPPDQSLVLVLSRRPAGEPRREVREQLPHSDLFFTCDDIQQTYRELTDRGVKFPTAPTQMHFGWWAMFEDQDGTRYALNQSS